MPIGDLAMAKRRDATTNGSQFFIISGDDGAALPPEYSLFGKVDPADLAVVATLDALGQPRPQRRRRPAEGADHHPVGDHRPGQLSTGSDGRDGHRRW